MTDLTKITEPFGLLSSARNWFSLDRWISAPRTFSYRVVRLPDGGFIAECAAAGWAYQLLRRDGVLEWPAVYASGLPAMTDEGQRKYIFELVEDAQKTIKTHKSLNDDRDVVWESEA